MRLKEQGAGRKGVSGRTLDKRGSFVVDKREVPYNLDFSSVPICQAQRLISGATTIKFDTIVTNNILIILLE